MEKEKINIYRVFPFLLIAGFIEGGAVMAIELISAKLIAPFYGNSLYVWSAVLAITLGGLATGYFWGGSLSEKADVKKGLIRVLFIVAALVLALPVFSSVVMGFTINLPLKAGIIISCFALLMPPLCCFGMVSPMIVSIISKKIQNPGMVSGTVYSISTAGGILFTFLTGYLLIPSMGLKASCYLISTTLFLSSALAWLGSKKA